MEIQQIIKKLNDKQFRRSLTNAVMGLAQVSAGLGYVLDIDFLVWVMGAGLTGLLGLAQFSLSTYNMLSIRKQNKLMTEQKEKTDAEKITDILAK